MDRSEPTSRRDPESSQCAAHGSKGRCQLRGSIGNSSASGGRWWCRWHYEVTEYGTFPSREHFEQFLDDLESEGDTRWAHRTRDAWWNLVQGIAGLGGWDYRRTEDEVITEPKEVPGY